MISAPPVRQKPPVGTPLAPGHPLRSGLMYFVPCWESSGAPFDIVGRLTHSLNASAAWATEASPGSGQAFNCNASSAGAYAALPASLQLPWPVTILTRVALTGTPVGGGNCWCGAFVGSGVVAYGILNNTNGTGAVRLRYRSAAATETYIPGYTLTTAYTSLAFVITAASSSFYVNGSLFGTQSFAASNCNYAAGYVGVGNNPDQSGTPGVSVDYGAIYSRALSAAEIAQWSANPWGIFGSYAAGPATPGYGPWLKQRVA